jgi:hypothetical protein
MPDDDEDSGVDSDDDEDSGVDSDDDEDSGVDSDVSFHRDETSLSYWSGPDSVQHRGGVVSMEK